MLLRAEFTDPLEAAVVLTDQRALWATPIRASFPSIFICCSSGIMAAASARTKSTPMAAKRVVPCFRFFTMKPKEKHRAMGISRISTFSRTLVSAVGFSKGFAELPWVIPPPLVPACLMAICEAASPVGMRCSVITTASGTGSSFTYTVPFSMTASSRIVPSAVAAIGSVRATYCSLPGFMGTPCQERITPETRLTGMRMKRMAPVMSCQKFPSAADCRPVRPRIRAKSTQMPTAADTKFWTVIPKVSVTHPRDSMGS